ncbi:MAG: hypothetical protein ACLFU1_07940 [Alphaproteobacteria bacterium]
MSDLFIEVDEALKQERLEKIWKEYGGIILGLLAMIILATASNAGYHAWIEYRNNQQTNQFLNVLNQADATTEDFLAIREGMTAGMKSIVNMHAAKLALDNADKEKALAIYRYIKSDSAQEKANPTFAALAKYMIISIDDTLSTDDKIAAYETIAQDKNNPWRYNALLEAALLEARHNKNYAKARLHLAPIFTINASAPKGLKQKAQSLDILYQAQQSDD